MCVAKDIVRKQKTILDGKTKPLRKRNFVLQDKKTSATICFSVECNLCQLQDDCAAFNHGINLIEKKEFDDFSYDSANCNFTFLVKNIKESKKEFNEMKQLCFMCNSNNVNEKNK